MSVLLFIYHIFAAPADSWHRCAAALSTPELDLLPAIPTGDSGGGLTVSAVNAHRYRRFLKQHLSNCLQSIRFDCMLRAPRSPSKYLPR